MREWSSASSNDVDGVEHCNIVIEQYGFVLGRSFTSQDRHGPRAGFRFPLMGLSRQRVLDAAIALIGSDGLAALTMRRLGHSLVVEAMAIYHYVRGRDDLLTGITQVLTADIAAATLPRGGTDWVGYLRSVGAGFRAVLVAHPAAFALLMTHPVSGQWWLRAPMNDPAWHRRFVETLLRCGFAPERADTAYRMFTSFLAGTLALEGVSLTAHPLQDDPHAALRRAVQGQADFDSSFAALIAHLTRYLDSSAGPRGGRVDGRM